MPPCLGAPPRTASRITRARRARDESGAADSRPVSCVLDQRHPAGRDLPATCDLIRRTGSLQLRKEVSGKPPHLLLRGGQLGVPGATPPGPWHQDESQHGAEEHRAREQPPDPGGHVGAVARHRLGSTLRQVRARARVPGSRTRSGSRTPTGWPSASGARATRCARGGRAVFDPVGVGSPADPSPPQAVRNTTSKAMAATTPAVVPLRPCGTRRPRSDGTDVEDAVLPDVVTQCAQHPRQRVTPDPCAATTIADDSAGYVELEVLADGTSCRRVRGQHPREPASAASVGVAAS